MVRLVVASSAAIALILFVAFIVSRLLRTPARGMSIRMQVFLALAMIVGTFAFGLGLMVIDRIEARAVRIAKQAAHDEAASVAGLLGRQMAQANADLRTIASRFAEESSSRPQTGFELIAPGGDLVYPRAQRSRRFTPGTVWFDADLVAKGERVGSVRVVKPTIVVKRLLADFAPTVLIISLVLGAAAALAAAWIGNAIAAPIEAISKFAERASEGERVHPPVANPGSREVARLRRSIDSMRRQLEGRPFVETFAADLSHELKNPVAAIRAAAELLDDSAIEEPELARRFVRRILEATARIERLLKDLVSLARIEARGPDSLEALELAALARVAAESFPEARARLTVEASGDTRVRGDAIWLTRALSNLLDNALVHGSAAGAITLAVRRELDSVRVRVSSDGEIPARIRPRAFRRFVTTRADKGGSGLGLAIVRAVADAHGGQATLEEPGPPRVTVMLELPPAR